MVLSIDNFNDDRIAATPIYWELIDACWTLLCHRQNNPVKEALVLSPFIGETTEAITAVR